MVIGILRDLDLWLRAENEEADKIGTVKVRDIQIHIIGQSALLEADLSIEVTATADVDLQFQLHHKVKKKLDELLRAQGKHLDPVGHEAWMPEETKYIELYSGDMVSAFIAEPVFIMVSKARMAPVKNRQLLVDYLASQDLDHRFFELCEKYKVDLEKLV